LNGAPIAADTVGMRLPFDPNAKLVVSLASVVLLFEAYSSTARSAIVVLEDQPTIGTVTESETWSPFVIIVPFVTSASPESVETFFLPTAM